jgi:hypothetical protein
MWRLQTRGVRDDIPDEAVLGVHFNLLQAFLTAILTLGPNVSIA